MKFLKIFLFFSIFTSVATAQVPMSKNDVVVGLNTNLSNSRLVDVQLSPIVGFMVTRNVMASASFVYNSSAGNKYSWVTGGIRYYNTKMNIKPSINTFAELLGGISTNEYDNYYGLSVGINAFLTNHIYLEPKLLFQSTYINSDNYTSVGLQLGAGIKF